MTNPNQYAWKGCHTVSVDSFSRHGIEQLFETAKECKRAVNLHTERSANTDADKELVKKVTNCCKGLILACVFYEPSTRTNCSFTAAMYRLGGSVVQVNSSASSVKKGETLSDTVRCLECYCDILVLRHPRKGSALEASQALKKPLLNAGDGAGEHPTQALLDLYTIMDEQGKIDGLEITLLGDLKYGRTTHSLAKLLSRYNVTINYVSPHELKIPEEVRTQVSTTSSVTQREFTDLGEVIATTDVLYVTRIQKERFDDIAEYDKVKDSFVIDCEVLKQAKTSLSVMHPLPRVNEIAVEVDADPRAAYFRQMENGLYVRMALIASTLGVL
mmetsp:Transcript_8581/g.10850  ORF Transcript_8581/g.10850 Transcript_8581/m.10850 type:complete len:330 (+) Transcript_8581:151-1140(+)|eukprot:CAMPEP_0204824810 /NCGR_PEP_ID=MMETSP1346-20131115/2785_1 /ASSEMBLY_ACC=CAM_ASM_000771 /TAXON_ID=215587 /ORGANISM="Aplanochytrium stocchinoi, Strain GSBS06" /LENGTH=329 /DNA_ID=CAMNT_0051952151 /DNA_START=157 /DNA_END=1146 /DNA_ORIENTATION=+